VWVDEPVKAGVASDAFLFAGFAKRALFLGHDGAAATRFILEVDRRGDGRWTALREVPVAAGVAGEWLQFPAEEAGAWIRVVSDRDQAKATAQFQYAAADPRGTERDPLFAGLAEAAAPGAARRLALLTRGGNQRTLSVLLADVTAGGTKTAAAYEPDRRDEAGPAGRPEGDRVRRQAYAHPRGRPLGRRGLGDPRKAAAAGGYRARGRRTRPMTPC
jgi:hypothetical protein